MVEHTGDSAFDVVGRTELARRRDCLVELVSVALGPERTIEQDPAFALRIIVDIGSKALSPAINDATTAVLAIDQLHHLVHKLGLRRLDTGIVRDREGRVRLRYRAPEWEDFV